MKRASYLFLFALLGAMAGFLVHAAIEIPVIYLLVSDFERYGLGLSWNSWETVHDIGAVFLLVFGALLGFLQGKKWWKVIYVERQLGIRY